ncbi:MAG: hypothetical protein WBS22_17720 [Methylocystis sp.]
MRKLALVTAAVIIAVSAPAMAANQHWNITEENAAGIKSAQGVWDLTTEGDKLSGTAALSLDNGNQLTYNVDGELKDGVYSVKLEKRSDDKKSCVWTGKAQSATALGKATGFKGDVVCDGAKFVLRATGL